MEKETGKARGRAGQRLGKGYQVRERGSNRRDGGVRNGAAPSIRGLSEQTHRLQLLLGSFGQLGQVQAVDKEGDGNGEEGRGQI